MIADKPQELENPHGRNRECEEALDMPLRVLVDEAMIAGWHPHDIYNALASLLENQRRAYEQDPDPAGR